MPGNRDAMTNAMYSELLEAVLAYEADPEARPLSQGPLADVLRLRRALDRRSSRDDPGWALQAVADQLAYDAALVRLARRRGIGAELARFDHPEQGRAELEEALLARGVNLSRRTAPSAEAADSG